MSKRNNTTSRFDYRGKTREVECVASAQSSYYLRVIKVNMSCHTRFDGSGGFLAVTVRFFFFFGEQADINLQTWGARRSTFSSDTVGRVVFQSNDDGLGGVPGE